MRYRLYFKRYLLSNITFGVKNNVIWKLSMSYFKLFEVQNMLNRQKNLKIKKKWLTLILSHYTRIFHYIIGCNNFLVYFSLTLNILLCEEKHCISLSSHDSLSKYVQKFSYILTFLYFQAQWLQLAYSID